MYKKYKNFIDKYISFNTVEWTLLKSKLKIAHFKKGEIIHYAGDVCTKMMFVNNGLARAYLLDEKGKDFTWSIFFNDENAGMTNLFIVDYDSFIHQSPSKISIEILEDCEVVISNYNDIQFLYNHLKKGERFGRVMSQEAYSYLHNYFIDRQTHSAKERYDDFIHKTPYLLDKVPQYQIASLLGITPQHLSRLKKESNN
jgi:CRP-like cAMP-binding protein